MVLVCCVGRIGRRADWNNSKIMIGKYRKVGDRSFSKVRRSNITAVNHGDSSHNLSAGFGNLFEGLLYRASSCDDVIN